MPSNKKYNIKISTEKTLHVGQNDGHKSRNHTRIRLVANRTVQAVQHVQTVQNVRSHCSSTFLCPLAPMLDSRSTAPHHSITPVPTGIDAFRPNTPIFPYSNTAFRFSCQFPPSPIST